MDLLAPNLGLVTGGPVFDRMEVDGIYDLTLKFVRDSDVSNPDGVGLRDRTARAAWTAVGSGAGAPPDAGHRPHRAPQRELNRASRPQALTRYCDRRGSIWSRMAVL